MPVFSHVRVCWPFSVTRTGLCNKVGEETDKHVIRRQRHDRKVPLGAWRSGRGGRCHLLAGAPSATEKKGFLSQGPKVRPRFVVADGQ